MQSGNEETELENNQKILMINVSGLIFLFQISLISKLAVSQNECTELFNEGEVERNQEKLKRCCSEIGISFFVESACLTSQIEGVHDLNITNEFSAFKNECNTNQERLIQDKFWRNEKNFDYCKKNNMIDRKLQLKSGFGSRIRLPQATSSLRGPQETHMVNHFRFETRNICESVLSLHYIKVCERLCDTRFATMVKDDVFPRSCFPTCVDFASHICIHGCELFGCDIPFIACTYQMCNFVLTQ
ncbi:hypothetical protein HWI79_1584 [Cryptosporidium felis]|nr:hypothetical protein HWI79_1584 [Cryptosporidium felis]